MDNILTLITQLSSQLHDTQYNHLQSRPITSNQTAQSPPRLQNTPLTTFPTEAHATLLQLHAEITNLPSTDSHPFLIEPIEALIFTHLIHYGEFTIVRTIISQICGLIYAHQEKKLPQLYKRIVTTLYDAETRSLRSHTLLSTLHLLLEIATLLTSLYLSLFITNPQPLFTMANYILFHSTYHPVASMKIPTILPLDQNHVNHPILASPTLHQQCITLLIALTSNRDIVLPTTQSRHNTLFICHNIFAYQPTLKQFSSATPQEQTLTSSPNPKLKPNLSTPSTSHHVTQLTLSTPTTSTTVQPSVVNHLISDIMTAQHEHLTHLTPTISLRSHAYTLLLNLASFTREYDDDICAILLQSMTDSLMLSVDTQQQDIWIVKIAQVFSLLSGPPINPSLKSSFGNDTGSSVVSNTIKDGKDVNNNELLQSSSASSLDKDNSGLGSTFFKGLKRLDPSRRESLSETKKDRTQCITTIKLSGDIYFLLSTTFRNKYISVTSGSFGYLANHVRYIVIRVISAWLLTIRQQMRAVYYAILKSDLQYTNQLTHQFFITGYSNDMIARSEGYQELLYQIGKSDRIKESSKLTGDSDSDDDFDDDDDENGDDSDDDFGFVRKKQMKKSNKPSQKQAKHGEPSTSTTTYGLHNPFQPGYKPVFDFEKLHQGNILPQQDFTNNQILDILCLLLSYSFIPDDHYTPFGIPFESPSNSLNNSGNTSSSTQLNNNNASTSASVPSQPASSSASSISTQLQSHDVSPLNILATIFPSTQSLVQQPHAILVSELIVHVIQHALIDNASQDVQMLVLSFFFLLLLRSNPHSTIASSSSLFPLTNRLMNDSTKLGAVAPSTSLTVSSQSGLASQSTPNTQGGNQTVTSSALTGAKWFGGFVAGLVGIPTPQTSTQKEIVVLNPLLVAVLPLLQTNPFYKQLYAILQHYLTQSTISTIPTPPTTGIPPVPALALDAVAVVENKAETTTITTPTCLPSHTASSQTLIEIITTPSLSSKILPIVNDLLGGCNLPLYLTCLKTILFLISNGLLSRIPIPTYVNPTPTQLQLQREYILQRAPLPPNMTTTTPTSTSLRPPPLPINSLLLHHNTSSTITLQHLLQLQTTNIHHPISSHYLYTLTSFSSLYDILTHLALSLIFTSSQPRYLYDNGQFDKITPSSPILQSTGYQLLLFTFRHGPREYRKQLMLYVFTQLMSALNDHQLVLQQLEASQQQGQQAEKIPSTKLEIIENLFGILSFLLYDIFTYNTTTTTSSSSTSSSQSPNDYDEDEIERHDENVGFIEHFSLESRLEQKLFSMFQISSHPFQRYNDYENSSNFEHANGSNLPSHNQYLGFHPYNTYQAMKLNDFLTEEQQEYLFKTIVKYFSLLNIEHSFTLPISDQRTHINNRSFYATIFTMTSLLIITTSTNIIMKHTSSLLKAAFSILSQPLFDFDDSITYSFITQHKTALLKDLLVFKTYSLFIVKSLIQHFHRRLTSGIKSGAADSKQSSLLQPILSCLQAATQTILSFNQHGPVGASQNQNLAHQQLQIRQLNTTSSTKSKSTTPLPSLLQSTLLGFRFLTYHCIFSLNIFDTHSIIQSILPILVQDCFNRKNSTHGTTTATTQKLLLPSLSPGTSGVLHGGNGTHEGADTTPTTPQATNVFTNLGASYSCHLLNTLLSIVNPQFKHLFNVSLFSPSTLNLMMELAFIANSEDYFQSSFATSSSSNLPISSSASAAAVHARKERQKHNLSLAQSYGGIKPEAQSVALTVADSLESIFQSVSIGNSPYATHILALYSTMTNHNHSQLPLADCTGSSIYGITTQFNNNLTKNVIIAPSPLDVEEARKLLALFDSNLASTTISTNLFTTPSYTSNTTNSNTFDIPQSPLFSICTTVSHYMHNYITFLADHVGSFSSRRGNNQATHMHHAQNTNLPINAASRESIISVNASAPQSATNSLSYHLGRHSRLSQHLHSLFSLVYLRQSAQISISDIHSVYSELHLLFHNGFTYSTDIPLTSPTNMISLLEAVLITAENQISPPAPNLTSSSTSSTTNTPTGNNIDSSICSYNINHILLLTKFLVHSNPQQRVDIFTSISKLFEGHEPTSATTTLSTTTSTSLPIRMRLMTNLSNLLESYINQLMTNSSFISPATVLLDRKNDQVKDTFNISIQLPPDLIVIFHIVLRHLLLMQDAPKTFHLLSSIFQLLHHSIQKATYEESIAFPSTASPATDFSPSSSPQTPQLQDLNIPTPLDELVSTPSPSELSSPEVVTSKQFAYDFEQVHAILPQIKVITTKHLIITCSEFLYNAIFTTLKHSVQFLQQTSTRHSSPPSIAVPLAFSSEIPTVQIPKAPILISLDTLPSITAEPESLTQSPILKAPHNTGTLTYKISFSSNQDIDTEPDIELLNPIFGTDNQVPVIESLVPSNCFYSLIECLSQFQDLINHYIQFTALPFVQRNLPPTEYLALLMATYHTLTLLPVKEFIVKEGDSPVDFFSLFPMMMAKLKLYVVTRTIAPIQMVSPVLPQQSQSQPSAIAAAVTGQHPQLNKQPTYLPKGLKSNALVTGSANKYIVFSPGHYLFILNHSIKLLEHTINTYTAFYVRENDSFFDSIDSLDGAQSLQYEERVQLTKQSILQGLFPVIHSMLMLALGFETYSSSQLSGPGLILSQQKPHSKASHQPFSMLTSNARSHLIVELLVNIFTLLKHDVSTLLNGSSHYHNNFSRSNPNFFKWFRSLTSSGASSALISSASCLHLPPTPTSNTDANSLSHFNTFFSRFNNPEAKSVSSTSSFLPHVELLLNAITVHAIDHLITTSTSIPALILSFHATTFTSIENAFMSLYPILFNSYVQHRSTQRALFNLSAYSKLDSGSSSTNNQKHSFDFVPPTTSQFPFLTLFTFLHNLQNAVCQPLSLASSIPTLPALAPYTATTLANLHTRKRGKHLLYYIAQSTPNQDTLFAFLSASYKTLSMLLSRASSIKPAELLKYQQLYKQNLVQLAIQNATSLSPVTTITPLNSFTYLVPSRFDLSTSVLGKYHGLGALSTVLIQLLNTFTTFNSYALSPELFVSQPTLSSIDQVLAIKPYQLSVQICTILQIIAYETQEIPTLLLVLLLFKRISWPSGVDHTAISLFIQYIKATLKLYELSQLPNFILLYQLTPHHVLTIHLMLHQLLYTFVYALAYAAPHLTLTQQDQIIQKSTLPTHLPRLSAFGSPPHSSPSSVPPPDTQALPKAPSNSNVHKLQSQGQQQLITSPTLFLSTLIPITNPIRNTTTTYITPLAAQNHNHHQLLFLHPCLSLTFPNLPILRDPKITPTDNAITLSHFRLNTMVTPLLLYIRSQKQLFLSEHISTLFSLLNYTLTLLPALTNGNSLYQPSKPVQTATTAPGDKSKPIEPPQPSSRPTGLTQPEVLTTVFSTFPGLDKYLPTFFEISKVYLEGLKYGNTALLTEIMTLIDYSLKPHHLSSHDRSNPPSQQFQPATTAQSTPHHIFKSIITHLTFQLKRYLSAQNRISYSKQLSESYTQQINHALSTTTILTTSDNCSMSLQHSIAQQVTFSAATHRNPNLPIQQSTQTFAQRTIAKLIISVAAQLRSLNLPSSSDFATLAVGFAPPNQSISLTQTPPSLSSTIDPLSTLSPHLSLLLSGTTPPGSPALATAPPQELPTTILILLHTFAATNELPIHSIHAFITLLYNFYFCSAITPAIISKITIALLSYLFYTPLPINKKTSTNPNPNGLLSNSDFGTNHNPHLFLTYPLSILTCENLDEAHTIMLGYYGKKQKELGLKPLEIYTGGKVLTNFSPSNAAPAAFSGADNGLVNFKRLEPLAAPFSNSHLHNITLHVAILKFFFFTLSSLDEVIAVASSPQTSDTPLASAVQLELHPIDLNPAQFAPELFGVSTHSEKDLLPISIKNLLTLKRAAPFLFIWLRSLVPPFLNFLSSLLTTTSTTPTSGLTGLLLHHMDSTSPRLHISSAILSSPLSPFTVTSVSESDSHADFEDNDGGKDINQNNPYHHHYNIAINYYLSQHTKPSVKAAVLNRNSARHFSRSNQTDVYFTSYHAARYQLLFPSVFHPLSQQLLAPQQSPAQSPTFTNIDLPTSIPQPAAILRPESSEASSPHVGSASPNTGPINSEKKGSLLQLRQQKGVSSIPSASCSYTNRITGFNVLSNINDVDLDSYTPNAFILFSHLLRHSLNQYIQPIIPEKLTRSSYTILKQQPTSVLPTDFWLFTPPYNRTTVTPETNPYHISLPLLQGVESSTVLPTHFHATPNIPLPLTSFCNILSQLITNAIQTTFLPQSPSTPGRSHGPVIHVVGDGSNHSNPRHAFNSLSASTIWISIVDQLQSTLQQINGILSINSNSLDSGTDLWAYLPLLSILQNTILVLHFCFSWVLPSGPEPSSTSILSPREATDELHHLQLKSNTLHQLLQHVFSSHHSKLCTLLEDKLISLNSNVKNMSCVNGVNRIQANQHNNLMIQDVHILIYLLTAFIPLCDFKQPHFRISSLVHKPISSVPILPLTAQSIQTAYTGCINIVRFALLSPVTISFAQDITATIITMYGTLYNLIHSAFSSPILSDKDPLNSNSNSRAGLKSLPVNATALDSDAQSLSPTLILITDDLASSLLFYHQMVNPYASGKKLDQELVQVFISQREQQQHHWAASGASSPTLSADRLMFPSDDDQLEVQSTNQHPIPSDNEEHVSSSPHFQPIPLDLSTSIDTDSLKLSDSDSIHKSIDLSPAVLYIDENIQPIEVHAYSGALLEALSQVYSNISHYLILQQLRQTTNSSYLPTFLLTVSALISTASTDPYLLTAYPITISTLTGLINSVHLSVLQTENANTTIKALPLPTKHLLSLLFNHFSSSKPFTAASQFDKSIYHQQRNIVGFVNVILLTVRLPSNIAQSSKPQLVFHYIKFVIAPLLVKYMVHNNISSTFPTDVCFPMLISVTNTFKLLSPTVALSTLLPVHLKDRLASILNSPPQP